MDFDILKIKLERAVTVSFYILSLLLPVTLGWLIYDYDLFFKTDLLKLILVSCTVSGSSIVFNFLLNAFFLGFITAISTTYSKYKTSSNDDNELNAPATDESVARSKFSENSLNIAFLLTDFSAMVIVINLIKLKFFDHEAQSTLLLACFKTYFLVLGIWYTLIILIFAIMTILFVKILRNKWKENFLAYLLFKIMLKKGQDIN